MYETMLSPVNLGGLVLKNRIIFAPTTLGLGKVELEERLKRIAAGGCSMIVIGDVPVSRHGPRSLYSKKGFAYYTRLCKVIHKEGCLVCAQLHQSDSNIMGMVKYIPGVLTKKVTMEELRLLLNQQVGAYITHMSGEKAASITSSFGSAAVLAKKAGFDMIQVHGDRMCGSFSSQIFNSRIDEYGGSPEKRTRFAVEAVSAVRKALPDIPIDYKLAVRQEDPHYGNAGVLLEELSVFVPRLEQAGVTSFHVALANHARLTDTIPAADHPYFHEEGCFLSYCDEVRNHTKLPLTGVGGLTNPDFIEQQLVSGRMDCAGMSRQLLADADWTNKLKQGKEKMIQPCVRCNKECLGGIQQHRGVHCIYDKKYNTEKQLKGD